MVKLEFRWWVWLAVAFLVMMIAQGAHTVGSAGVDVAHAAYSTAGDLDKGLHGMETCGKACSR